MYVEDILSGSLTGKIVKLRGWVYRKREQKEIIFIMLRDVSGVIQIACKDIKDASKVTIESSIEVEGIVKEDKRAPGGYEIECKELKIIGLAERFPISKDLSEEFIRDVRHLWLRSEKMTSIMKIRSTAIDLIHEWFKKQKFIHISPPMFVSGACEGGSTLFEVGYFGKKAYLTQSWQLYAEALLPSLEKIYTIAPSFRAEKSRTIRHLTEFWHVEAEQAFADIKDIMKIQEELISFICKGIAEKCKRDLEILKVDPKKLEKIKPPFEKITYDKAIEILHKKGIKIKHGEDLGYDEEKVLADEFEKPVFVYAYPRKIKAFYCKTYKDKPDLAMSADLIVKKIGELTTGGSRIDDKDELIKRMKEFGLRHEDYDWYIDIRRYGTVPHAGFGLGLERLLAWILELESVFDTIPFPRTIARCYP